MTRPEIRFLKQSLPLVCLLLFFFPVRSYAQEDPMFSMPGMKEKDQTSPAMNGEESRSRAKEVRKTRSNDDESDRETSTPTTKRGVVFRTPDGSPVFLTADSTRKSRLVATIKQKKQTVYFLVIMAGDIEEENVSSNSDDVDDVKKNIAVDSRSKDHSNIDYGHLTQEEILGHWWVAPLSKNHTSCGREFRVLKDGSTELREPDGKESMKGTDSKCPWYEGGYGWTNRTEINPGSPSEVHALMIDGEKVELPPMALLEVPYPATKDIAER
ncbi:MAG: hypothetical protein V1495_11055 [Pseudomonadota bacterium]